LKKHVLNLKGIFVNGTMKPAGSRAVAARTMAGMMEEVTDCGSSCRIHFSPRPSSGGNLFDRQPSIQQKKNIKKKKAAHQRRRGTFS
jgi:hypothetical protein